MKNLISLICLAVLSFSLFAQKIETNQQFSVNSPYLFDTFKNGVILFKDGTSSEKGVNFDVIIDEIHYIQNSNLMTFSETDWLSIEKINIENLSFIAHKNKIYELIYSSNISILKRRSYDKSALNETEGAYGISTTTASTQNVSQLTYSPNTLSTSTVVNIKNDSNKQITIQETFSLRHYNNIYKATVRSFTKMFPEHKSDIKNFISKNNFKLNKVDDLLKIIEYCANF